MQSMERHEPAGGPQRILIAATPKTGNTWLKLLLSRIYGLRVVKLPAPFSPPAWDGAGERWVAHQHVMPSPALREWARSRSVRIITTIRHPGDVLVSLFHYARWAGVNDDVRAMAKDGGSMGPNTTQYVFERRFLNLLRLSAGWLELSAPAVRYEDLLTDPVGTLLTLTADIAPVDRARIEGAVAACEIGQLRRLKGHEERHFRAGRQGQWRVEVPKQILTRLRCGAAYMEVNKRLGYSFEPSATPDPPPFDYATINPFFGRECFDNGVPVPPIAVDLYFSDPRHRERWPDPVHTSGTDSFYHWLINPEPAPDGATDSGKLTPLFRYLLEIRGDVRASFPDAAGSDYRMYCLWLLRHGQREYELADELLAGARQAASFIIVQE